MKSLTTYLALAILLASSSYALSADTNDAALVQSGSPRIGLVLGGGGARGAAHVGVLRLLEELHIPVDCIAGTSMGAIIGGFYSAGLSPDEIEAVLVEVDWAQAFDDTVPRQELSFRRKEEDRRYPFNMELGYRDRRFRTKSGMLAGQNLNLILREVTLHMPLNIDFDTLPIRYRAVATDVDRGEAVVLSQGDMATAMRASMSIPGAFTPVKIDGRRLIDGGVINNLPVNVVRDMGADVIIAVDVRPALDSSGKSDSALTISAQAVDIAIRQSDKINAEDADYLIHTPMSGYTAADFPEAKAMIELGYEAALPLKEELAQYSVSDAAFEEHIVRHRAQRPENRHVDKIQISGNEEASTRLIKSRIEMEPGADLDLKLIRKDLMRIYGLGEFEAVLYSLDREGELTVLNYETLEKSWGPNYIHAGMKISDDFEGNNSYGVLLNFTKTRLNARGGEWRNDVYLGEVLAYETELYQPLDFNHHFFVAPCFAHGKQLEDVYEGDRRVAEYKLDELDLGLDLGTQVGKYGEMRLGYRWGTADAEAEVGSTNMPDFEVQFAGVFARVVFDRLDNANLPRDGSRTEVLMFWSQDEFGADDSYEKLSVGIGKFQSYGRHTFFVEGGAGTCLESELPEYDEFTLGGLFSLSGYGEGQLRGRHFSVGSLGYYYMIFPLPPGLGEGVFVGAKLDAGNAWQEKDDAAISDLKYGGAVFLGADTIAGPMYLGYGMAEENISRFYFSLGSTF